MINFSPIQPLLLATIVAKSYDRKDFCQYHHQNGHDIEKCCSLKYKVEDLIDCKALSVDNFDGSGKKYVSPPNQNLQIYRNHLPTHDTNTISQASSMDFMYDSKMDDLNHVVNQMDNVVQYVSPHQSQTTSI